MFPVEEMPWSWGLFTATVTLTMMVFLRLVPAMACSPWNLEGWYPDWAEQPDEDMKTAWPSLLASAALSSNGPLNPLTYFLGYMIAVKVLTPSWGSEK